MLHFLSRKATPTPLGDPPVLVLLRTEDVEGILEGLHYGIQRICVMHSRTADPDVRQELTERLLRLQRVKEDLAQRLRHHRQEARL